MSFESIRNRIAKLGPKPSGWKRKPTTAESRQEMDRLMAEILSQPEPSEPSGPPPVLSREEQERYDEIKAEFDALIAEDEKRIADRARYDALSWAEKLGARMP